MIAMTGDLLKRLTLLCFFYLDRVAHIFRNRIVSLKIVFIWPNLLSKKNFTLWAYTLIDFWLKLMQWVYFWYLINIFDRKVD